MKIRAAAVVAIAVVAAAWIAGCSGSGGSAVTPMTGREPGFSSAPTPTPTPIQLVPGTTVGTAVFPEGDTSTGGQGQQVDGVNCRSFLNNQFHHHVHLAMFVNGEQIALPRGTGMKDPGTNSFVYHAACFYFLHTHDATGIIHIEPPISELFGLRQYFAIWGRPLSANGFAGYTGAVTVYVNGVAQPAGTDPRSVAFAPFEQISLVIGTPPSWIPVYVFPPNYK